MRTSEVYLSDLDCRQEISHHYWHFAETKRQAGEWEKFVIGKKGKLPVCPDWRLLAWEIRRQANRKWSILCDQLGHITSILWLVLYWSNMAKTREAVRYQAISYQLGPKCYRSCGSNGWLLFWVSVLFSHMGWPVTICMFRFSFQKDRNCLRVPGDKDYSHITECLISASWMW